MYTATPMTWQISLDPGRRTNIDGIFLVTRVALSRSWPQLGLDTQPRLGSDAEEVEIDAHKHQRLVEDGVLTFHTVKQRRTRRFAETSCRDGGFGGSSRCPQGVRHSTTESPCCTNDNPSDRFEFPRLCLMRVKPQRSLKDYRPVTSPTLSKTSPQNAPRIVFLGNPTTRRLVMDHGLTFGARHRTCLGILQGRKVIRVRLLQLESKIWRKPGEAL